MMKLQGFVLPEDWLGQMVDIFAFAIAMVILLVIGGYACSRAVALAWFRTKLEFVRTVLREGAHGDGKK